MIATNQIQVFETPGAAWRWACDLIERFGKKVITEDGQTTKEIQNLVLQVRSPHIGWPIAGSGWKIPALDIYVADQILSSANRTGFSYTYGERIVPQIDSLIAKLKANPETRRAVISLWQESDYGIEHPPCWMVLEFLYRSEELHLTAFIRSNDIRQAWPANMYGLSKLLLHVATCAEMVAGSITTISTSAHIYEA